LRKPPSTKALLNPEKRKEKRENARARARYKSIIMMLLTQRLFILIFLHILRPEKQPLFLHILRSAPGKKKNRFTPKRKRKRKKKNRNRV